MVYADRVRGARSRDRNFTGRKWAKKLTNLNRCISVITDIDEKWFSSINHLSFIMFVYSNLNIIFLVLHLFSNFFLFCRYLLLNRQTHSRYLKFKRLKIPGRTFVRQKSEVPDRGIPLNRFLQNFELVNR